MVHSLYKIRNVLLFGIVAAILFPVFARARENARRSSCQSNLKQLGLAVAQYCQDYDEKHPLARHSKGVTGWTEAISPYIASTDNYRCPSAVSSAGTADYNGANATDYFYNSRLSSYIAPAENWHNGVLARVVLMGDGEVGLRAPSRHYTIGAIPPAWNSSEDSPRKRHLEGSNFAFVDGHVKWFRAGATFSTASPQNADPTFAPK